MIRILDRLVALTFLRLFVVFLMASPVLFVLGDITEHLDDYLDRGLTGMEVAKAYFFQLPLFLQWSFPIAALIAAVFTVHSMTTHREIVAAKAGGISFHRLVGPVLVMGVVLTGVALLLTDAVPRSNRIAGQILRSEARGRTWRTDFVYQSEAGWTWQVGRLTADDGRMSRIILERPGDEARAGLHVTADAATWDPAEGWTFQRGYYRLLQPDSTVRSFQFERLHMAGIDERPDELLDATPETEEMTYGELERMARIVERTGGNAKKLRVKMQQKLAIPAATLVVILFGAPLATSSKRGGAAYGIGISLGTTILYLLLLKVLGALGSAGTLPTTVAAWSPNVLFLVAGSVLLARVRT